MEGKEGRETKVANHFVKIAAAGCWLLQRVFGVECYMPRGNDEKQQLGFWDERRCHTVLNATITVGLQGFYAPTLVIKQASNP